VRSTPAFFAVAAAVTLSPGPAFALMLQIAARDGWRPAMANIAGNSVGVLGWGILSSLGVSALVAVNRVAYDVLHFGGAAFLIWLGLRGLLATRAEASGKVTTSEPVRPRTPRQAARKGIVNSVANPKLAVFFISLFPQFVAPGQPLLPAALLMSVVIVGFDIAWYGTVAFLIDRLRRTVVPRATRALERTTGAVLLGFGVRLAAETR
jgi:threonine/homoserine/homoserine lactone efflux protein